MYKMADFIKALDRNPDKIAQNFSLIIRQRLREIGPARLILPPIYKTPADLQKDPESGELYDLMTLEPEAMTEFAFVLTPQGDVHKRQVKTEYVPMPMIQIATDEVEVNKIEAASYPFSIQQWLESNVIRDIEREETEYFLKLAVAAANGVGNIIDVNASAWITFQTLIDSGISNFNKSEKTGVASVVLLHQSDFDKILANVVATTDQFAMTVLREGWQLAEVMGYKFLISRKSTLISPGVIYIFAKPEWLGQFTLVADAQFFVENKARTFNWQVFEYACIGIGNPYGTVILKHASITVDQILSWPYPDKGLLASSQLALS